MVRSCVDSNKNDLPVSPIFVPFVVETARYLTGMETSQGQAIVGSVLELSRRRSAGAMVQVFDPAGDRALSLSEAVSRDDLDLDQVGFYDVRRAGSSKLIAVNPDPLESNLRPIDSDTLELWKSTGRDESGITLAGGEESPLRPPPLRIWRLLLLLLVSVVLIESVVGNRHLDVKREV